MKNPRASVRKALMKPHPNGNDCVLCGEPAMDFDLPPVLVEASRMRCRDLCAGCTVHQLAAFAMSKLPVQRSTEEPCMPAAELPVVPRFNILRCKCGCGRLISVKFWRQRLAEQCGERVTKGA